jgi:hypothetical protein
MTEGDISRRDFLKLAGLGAGVLAGGGILHAIRAIGGDRPQNQSEARSTPHPVSDYIRQTQTAMESNNSRTSFVEGNGFSKEIFDRVCNSTFIIDMVIQDDEYIATAWLAKVEGDSKYFVTCKHDIPDWNTLKEVRLCRPGIDNSVFASSNVEVASSNRDIVVLKVGGNYQTSTPLEPMNFQDNRNLSSETGILVVGFPMEFMNVNQLQNSQTMGTVVKVEDGHFSLFNGSLAVKAAISFGVSGSPVIVNEAGNAKVVGVAYGRSDTVFPGDKNISPALFIERLNIEPLMDSLRQT